MKLIIKYKLTIVGMFLGAILGFAYYYFVGCANGTCAITSSPINSTLYGSFVGGLLFHSQKK
jgi:phage shock protein E